MKMPRIQKIAYTVPALLLTTASLPAHAEWNYMLTPYLWASNLNGTTAIAGRDVDFDASFSDLVSSLDAGFAARFEAEAEAFGYFVDGNFVKLKDDQQTVIGAAGFTVNQKIVEAAITYRLNDQLKVYGGGRYQKLDVDVTLPILGERGTGDSWSDGIIGLIWEPVNTAKWSLRARTDIGAGDSDSNWQFGISGGYHFNDTFSFVLAYRYLDTDYESDQFKWDVSQSGFGTGLGIRW